MDGTPIAPDDPRLSDGGGGGGGGVRAVGAAGGGGPRSQPARAESAWPPLKGVGAAGGQHTQWLMRSSL
jgi:hypothetical protein